MCVTDSKPNDDTQSQSQDVVLVVHTAKDPTIQAATELQTSYNFFNRELFNEKLPACLITLQRRRSGMRGYYARDRFTNVAGDVADEIALNPRWFRHRSLLEVMSTLVHEMAHLWQRHFGRPSCTAYHNREWARVMLQLGLRPSRTGAPRGPMTGRTMTHYIVPGGAFDVAAKKLLATPLAITWFDADGARQLPFDPLSPKGAELGGLGAAGRRRKFTCPSCKDSAWGKASLQIDCRKCERPMERTTADSQRHTSPLAPFLYPKTPRSVAP